VNSSKETTSYGDHIATKIDARGGHPDKTASARKQKVMKATAHSTSLLRGNRLPLPMSNALKTTAPRILEPHSTNLRKEEKVQLKPLQGQEPFSFAEVKAANQVTTERKVEVRNKAKAEAKAEARKSIEVKDAVVVDENTVVALEEEDEDEAFQRRAIRTAPMVDAHEKKRRRGNGSKQDKKTATKEEEEEEEAEEAEEEGDDWTAEVCPLFPLFVVSGNLQFFPIV